MGSNPSISASLSMPSDLIDFLKSSPCWSYLVLISTAREASSLCLLALAFLSIICSAHQLATWMTVSCWKGPRQMRNVEVNIRQI